MEIERTEQNSVLVLAVSGRLTAAGGDQVFKREIARALDEGRTRLVVDFGDLQTLDSSGLGELVAAATRIAARKARMFWAACPRNMLDLFEIIRVEPPGVEIFGTTDEAVRALSGG
jgi:anti-sigma B factor antagonist